MCFIMYNVILNFLLFISAAACLFVCCCCCYCRSMPRSYTDVCCMCPFHHYIFPGRHFVYTEVHSVCWQNAFLWLDWRLNSIIIFISSWQSITEISYIFLCVFRLLQSDHVPANVARARRSITRAFPLSDLNILLYEIFSDYFYFFRSHQSFYSLRNILEFLYPFFLQTFWCVSWSWSMFSTTTVAINCFICKLPHHFPKVVDDLRYVRP